MTRLQKWMDRNKETDASLAEKVNVSRASISRIRRGRLGASKATALRLQEVTGIPWHTFIAPGVSAPRMATQ